MSHQHGVREAQPAHSRSSTAADGRANICLITDNAAVRVKELLFGLIIIQVREISGRRVADTI